MSQPARYANDMRVNVKAQVLADEDEIETRRTRRSVTNSTPARATEGNAEGERSAEGGGSEPAEEQEDEDESDDDRAMYGAGSITRARSDDTYDIELDSGRRLRRIDVEDITRRLDEE